MVVPALAGALAFVLVTCCWLQMETTVHSLYELEETEGGDA